LPSGFLAIDIAHHLNLPIFDSDSTITVGGTDQYKPVDPTLGQTTSDKSARPFSGNCFIGGTGAITTTTDAKVIVAANGGSDLIYLIERDRAFAQELVDFLSGLDYVSGIFSNSAFGSIKGALPLQSSRFRSEVRVSAFGLPNEALAKSGMPFNRARPRLRRSPFAGHWVGVRWGLDIGCGVA
jgi:hypothetical protein